MLTLELRAEFGSPDAARAVLDALSPDNTGYVESELVGNTIIFRMSAESAGTLRSTADDLMACLKTAEEAVGAGSRRWDVIRQQTFNHDENHSDGRDGFQGDP